MAAATPSDNLLEALHAEDVTRARQLVANHSDLAPPGDLKLHPILRQFVDENDGHCYRAPHLAIADLLLNTTVREFRDAVIGDHSDDVRLALERAPALANVEFTAGRGIASTVHHWKSVGVAQLLIESGAELAVLTTRGESPVAMQARFGSVVGIRWLLENGADPNFGDCPHIPSSRLVEVIELLLGHGWDIQSNNQLLHDANHGHGQRVVTWLSYGVDPNLVRDGERQTALHLLAAKGTGRTAIRALVEAGADVQAQDAQGRTPLDLARLASNRSAEHELTALIG